jgi:hypothetical protein
VELTNDYGYVLRANLLGGGQINIPAGNGWPGWSQRQADGSLLVPLRTNHIIVPDLVCAQNNLSFLPTDSPFATTPTSPVRLPFPRWGLTITNRVVGYIRDSSTGRLLDYVQLSGMAAFRDITGEMAQPPTALDFDGLWATNATGTYLSGEPGVRNQIMISAGADAGGGVGNGWQNNGIQQPSGATKYEAIAKFRAFFTPNNRATFTDRSSGIVYAGENTTTEAVAPFSPTWKQSVPMVWQANDPLIHYTAGDMEYLEKSQVPTRWAPASATNAPTLVNLGRVNERYRPWGGNPFMTGGGSSIETDVNAYNSVFKDPGVRSSANWQFPTNKLATLGWLGRIHRGSPWQTIYLKANPATNAETWRRWSGNRAVFDAANTQPETDRALFDVFTTALNENASRGQLPINQTNLAAWSAVFAGMVALTNSTTDVELDDISPRFDPWITDPAGVYDPLNTNTFPAVVKIVEGINRERMRTVPVNGTNVFVHGTHHHLAFPQSRGHRRVQRSQRATGNGSERRGARMAATTDDVAGETGRAALRDLCLWAGTQAGGSVSRGFRPVFRHGDELPDHRGSGDACCGAPRGGAKQSAGRGREL